MAQNLAELQAAVEANGQATASAVTLIEGLADRLKEAINASHDQEDDQPLHDLLNDLRAQTSGLAEAVVKGTPAEPAVQSAAGAPDPNAPAAADPASGAQS